MVRRRRYSKKQRTLQDILDSDDELTDNYTESYFVPAYQDDSRFDHIQNRKTKPEVASQSMHSKGTINAIRTAWLTKRDTYCYQFVEKKMPRYTSKWFFYYLLYKDVQTKYKFMKSCLVPKYFH